MFLCLNSWNQLIRLFNVKTHHRIHAAFVFHAIHMLSKSLFIKIYLQPIITPLHSPYGSFCKDRFYCFKFFHSKFKKHTYAKNLSEWPHITKKYMSYKQLTMHWLFTTHSMITICITKCLSRLNSSYAFKIKITVIFFLYKIN